MNHMQIGRVGIVGANEDSIAIAMGLADAGIPVTLYDAERGALDKVLAQARAGEGGDGGRMALLATTVNFHHLKDCDLIVDAEGGDKAAREALFRRLDQVARLGAVLATCAPDAGLDDLAGCTRRSGEVIGLQVRQSAPAMWEVVPTRHTSGATLATVNALVRKLQEADSAARHSEGLTALAA